MKIYLKLPAKGQRLSRGTFELFRSYLCQEATDYAVLNGATPYRYNGGCWLDLKNDVLAELSDSLQKKELLKRDIFGRLGVNNVKPTHRNPSVVPVLDFGGFENNLIKYATSPKYQNLHIMSDKRHYASMLVTEFGTYPQSIVDDYVEKHLNRDFKLGKLVQSNAVYTIDGAKDNEPFAPVHNRAYVLDNELYVRAIATKNNSDAFSNGTEIITGRGYWFKVEPVRWMMEKEENTEWISQFGLLSGLQFDNKDVYKDDNLRNTTIYKFMQEYMLPEMLQGWDFNGHEADYEKRMKIVKQKFEYLDRKTSGLRQRLANICIK